MKIGILGSGLMGGKLGVHFAQAGHDVTFSYSRRMAKLDDLAKRAGHGAKAGSVADAVRDADVVFLAVHWSRVDDVLSQAGDLSGKTVLTCCVPLNAGNTDLVVGLTESGAEHLARKMPGARLATAFQTTPSESFAEVFDGRGRAIKPNCVYCGDDRQAKEAAARLIADIGFAPIDAGPLKVARYTEPFAMLTAQLAYGTSEGPNWGYRFARVDRLVGG